jgi:D-glycero-alpha-D-manno-heptose 1-phosphate guanylyltransferase
MSSIGKEVIVLAGGLGTRLRSSIGEIPKCMAAVCGKPFLYYIFQYLIKEQVEHVVLSLGYKHEHVLEWLDQQWLPFKLSWSIESEPLGTGGGIHLALSKCTSAHVFILNGDTMFPVSLNELQQLHLSKSADVTVALKFMENFDRYGTVRIDDEGLITGFVEKAPTQNGFINGGVYLLDRERFLSMDFPKVFSFERDFLEKFVDRQKFYAFESNSYFIDIGVPDDYQLAQTQFQTLFP